jgi:hypothetical protein
MMWAKRALGIFVMLAVVLLAVVGTFFASMHEHRPDPVISAQADAMARRMIEAVDVDAWERTGAVAWTFGVDNRHLWDRVRHFDRFQQGGLVVLIDLNSRRGVAWTGQRELSGAELDAALSGAWDAWCNDSFWLNPVVKAFDSGTSRGTVALEDGRTGLMVSYDSGGVTPGDSYLWILGDDGTPESWKMWVSILPVGGVQTTWEGWQTLPTGARIATQHTGAFGVVIAIHDVRGAATLAEIASDDPFAKLVGR